MACILAQIASVESSLTRLGAGERRSSDVHFIRDFTDWEMVEGVTFLRILGANIPLMDVGDRMRWKLKPNGDLDIRSFYNKLRHSPFVVFPWKGIWRVKAPQCVSFFVWSIAWNRIHMGDNLRLRSFDFVDWCIMCHHRGETMDHLLLHCEKAHHQQWSFDFTSFGISWVIPRTIPNLLFGWQNWLGKQSSNIWNLVPLCLLWCLWKERNWQTFEDLDSFKDQMLTSLSGSVELYSTNLGLGDS